MTRAGAKAGKRRVLVTGGAGFVGSHLCEQLLSEGYSVVLEMIPFFALGTLGIATFVVASGALHSVLRAKNWAKTVASCCTISKSASGCCVKTTAS